MTTRPPEKLDAQVVDFQHSEPFQFLASLLRRRGGWVANHALICVPKLITRRRGDILESFRGRR